ncbi:MAG: membrane protein of unknown function [Promethearchaeota archaeon]|nr:MAG: membrane protein of unknown function [Candidatus Lokiarchaeota archaeon]
MAPLEPNSLEYQIFLILVILLLVAKLSFSVYLGIKIYKKTKNQGKFTFDFIFGVFTLMICLLVSRLLYLFYDFFLTQFNPANFLDPNALTVWAFASLISTLGYSAAMFTVDYRVLHFRLKGIFAYIILGVGIFDFIYVMGGFVTTEEAFDLVNGILIISNVLAIIIPIIFFYIGIKTTGLRKTAFIIAFGVIIFSIGSSLVLQPIIAPLRDAFGDTIQIPIFFMFFLFKLIGLGMFSYGVTQFSL